MSDTHAVYRVTPWTPDRITLMEARWANGCSAGEIALELNCGITRSAVIGRAHRCKLAREIDRNLWSEAETETLRTLWLEGVSAEKIALELTRRGWSGQPLTRSAVLAKAHRLGYPKRFKTCAAVRQKKDKRPRKERRAATIYVNPDCDLKIPFEQRKAIETIGMHDCRWPVGDPGTPGFFFCGAAKLTTGPYCLDHHSRAYGYVNEARFPKAA